MTGDALPCAVHTAAPGIDAFVIDDAFVIKTEAMKAAIAAAEREYEGCTRAGIAELQGVLNAATS